MGELKKWRDQEWVRIDSSGNIAGECGTSKDKKNPDRCLPRSKAESLSKSERAATARKKKSAGSKGKTVVSNTEKAKVRKAAKGGEIKKYAIGGEVRRNHRGCGSVISERRKKTRYT